MGTLAWPGTEISFAAGVRDCWHGQAQSLGGVSKSGLVLVVALAGGFSALKYVPDDFFCYIGYIGLAGRLASGHFAGFGRKKIFSETWCLRFFPVNSCCILPIWLFQIPAYLSDSRIHWPSPQPGKNRSRVLVSDFGQKCQHLQAVHWVFWAVTIAPLGLS